jgi:hypothetical protein
MVRITKPTARVQRRSTLHSPPYRPRTINRSRLTKRQVEQLERQIHDVLEQTPQSVRHVFYRMTNPTLAVHVPKTQKGYRIVQERTKRMRRAGTLPYGWLTDTTRSGSHVHAFDGAADFIRRVKGAYRADLWKSANDYCEVWVESRSIAGVIGVLCDELAVRLFPCGGFPSITFVHEACVEINERISKPVTVFYAGDYDPAGVLIDQKLEQEMRRHLDPRIDLTFERIAINLEQIRRYNLPTKPPKESDPRRSSVKTTVEAEAMPAETLIELLRSKIEALLPEGALEVAKVAEEDEKRYLDLFANRIEKRRKQ